MRIKHSSRSRRWRRRKSVGAETAKLCVLWQWHLRILCFYCSRCGGDERSTEREIGWPLISAAMCSEILSCHFNSVCHRSAGSWEMGWLLRAKQRTIHVIDSTESLVLIVSGNGVYVFAKRYRNTQKECRIGDKISHFKIKTNQQHDIHSVFYWT